MTTKAPPADLTVMSERSSQRSADPFGKEEHPDRLPFSFFVNAIGKYPDTGESGDAYDAETFLEADRW